MVRETAGSGSPRSGRTLCINYAWLVTCWAAVLGSCLCKSASLGRCCYVVAHVITLPCVPLATRTAVHVEACNAAAAALYLSSGFDVESEEAEAFARAQNRNRRLLLHCKL